RGFLFGMFSIMDIPPRAQAQISDVRQTEATPLRSTQAQQIATRCPDSGVRRPSKADTRTKGRRSRPPGPGGAPDRYALLEFRRPTAVQG
ncbi:hypothetical protein ACFWJT_06065, partial [Streptomyces sp. NPDC127069]|uniref:hypothetical protein n=1 Tax=Streptomyces sp. NPDC127069 TaxID=3347128 RepID=UPI0036548915